MQDNSVVDKKKNYALPRSSCVVNWEPILYFFMNYSLNCQEIFIPQLHLSKSLTILQGPSWPSKSIAIVSHHIVGHIWTLEKVITNFKLYHALLNYIKKYRCVCITE